MTSDVGQVRTGLRPNRDSSLATGEDDPCRGNAQVQESRAGSAGEKVQNMKSGLALEMLSAQG